MSPQNLICIAPLGQLGESEASSRADGRVPGAWLGAHFEPVQLPPASLLRCPVPPVANAPFFRDGDYDCRGRLVPVAEGRARRGLHG